MKRYLALAALLLLAAPAAYGLSWNGAPDPFQLAEYAPAGFTQQVIPLDVSYKTLGTQTINTAVQNCFIIQAGQSNNVNTAPSNFLPTNVSSIDNLNPYDGAIYKAADPLVGTSPAPVGQSPQPTVAAFTATQATTVLNVSAVSAGTLGVGQTISGAGSLEVIISLGTGVGGPGTYNVSVSQTVASATAMTATPNGGNPMLRLADKLVTDGKCSRVIIVPVSISSTAVAVWDIGGVLWQRIPVAMRRIAQRLNQTSPLNSLKCGSTNITCVVLWGQGESDTAAGTTQTAYTNSLNSMISTSNTTATSLGWTSGTWGRWLIAKQSYYLPGPAVDAAIQAAQHAVTNGTQIFDGANADALVGNVCGPSANAACRDAGSGIHWTDNGSYSYARDATNGWQQALHSSGSPF